MRPPPISRRTMVIGAGAAGMAAAAGGLAIAPGPAMAGTLSGADMARGHRLRDGRFPPPAEERRADVVIVGGGVAGLAAAWTLAEAGCVDLRLLELEDVAGGNARGGRNAASAFPLGAHYLPIPNVEAASVRHLLERIGIITGWRDGKPTFDPYQVVSDPDERLLYLGRWQEGLVPALGRTDADRGDLAAFFAAMRDYRDRRGADGRPAFAIPMEHSSRDPDLLALDKLSFAAWLDARGWHSPILRGHLRYCCRDDYGTEPGEVSAWAGIHYFAGRRGARADGDGDAVLTWPDGNAYLARAMAAPVADRIFPAQIVHRVRAERGEAVIDSYDTRADRTIRWRARAAILATPRFVTARLLGEAPSPGPGPGMAFGYAPWVVANVLVDRPPAGPGAQGAWDNVSWTSESLGYVVATHQGLEITGGPTTLSWYMPLSTLAPADARRLMLRRSLAEWQRIVGADLTAMNPDLTGAIRRIDVWRWGHAMIRPVPGFIWGGARAAAATPRPPMWFAHSDLSGLSIFEEAHYRGTLAAERAMVALGHPFIPILAG